MTDEANATYKMCNSILGALKTGDIRPVVKGLKKKDAENLLLPVPARLRLLDSAEHPFPLCRCKIQEAAAAV